MHKMKICLLGRSISTKKDIYTIQQYLFGDNSGLKGIIFRCDFLNVGVGVTVFVGVGVVWAVNGEAVEGGNVSNDCALHRSLKWCFTPFYSVLFYSISIL